MPEYLDSTVRPLTSRRLQYLEALKNGIYNRRVFELIDETTKVLDVGCGAGGLGGRLREDKRCFVAGLELDPEMANIARSRCDQVIQADVEELPQIPFKDDFFDVVVFADVLEHLHDPGGVLRWVRRYLSDSGYLIASIPNIGYVKVRLMLLCGKFEFADYGVLDPTHLHFYVEKTARRLFEENGFRVTSFEGYNEVRDRYFLLKWAGRRWRRLFANDFIIKAVKKHL